MKKILAIILVLTCCLSSFLLAGCDRRGNQAPEVDLGSGYDGSAVTITFYHTMGADLQGVLNTALEAFNEMYPNITVEHKTLGDYDALRKQISTDLTVGGQPNVAYCYPDHVAGYNVAKAVLPLDELINSKFEVTRKDGTKEVMGFTQDQVDSFIKGFYEEGRQFGDGKMYTLPFAKSTEVLYYNKTYFEANRAAFEAAGITIPGDAPLTWDDMEAICKKIKELEPKSTPLGYDSESNWFITMCEQSGSPYTSASGDHYLFDNETNWAFVERFASWYADGLVTTEALAGGYTSGTFVLAEGEVGKSYMSIGSSAGAKYQRPTKGADGYPFEVGITTIPQLDLNNPKVISQGPSICIFKDSNEQEVYASWLLVKFLTTDVDFQYAVSTSNGYVPAIKTVHNDEIYQEFLNSADGGDHIQALSAKQCLAQENAYYTSPAFNGSSKAREEVGLLMQMCFAEYEAATDKLATIKKIFKERLEECEY